MRAFSSRRARRHHRIIPGIWLQAGDELAISHAVKKPAVHLIADEEEIPLNVNQIRNIQFKLAVPDNFARAREQVTEQVQALEKGNTTITHRANEEYVSKSLRL